MSEINEAVAPTRFFWLLFVNWQPQIIESILMIFLKIRSNLVVVISTWYILDH